MKNFHAAYLGYVAIIIALCPITVLSDSYVGKQMISVDSMAISAASENELVLSVTGSSKISAKCTLTFHTPNLMNDTTIVLSMQAAESRVLTVILPLRNGSWFTNVTFSVIDSTVKSLNKDSLFYWKSSNALFYRIKNNILEFQDAEPDSNDVKIPVLTMGHSMPSLIGSRAKSEQIQTFTISVSITGQVLVGTTGNTRGVPVRVWLDWDSDNNTATSSTPYFWSNSNPNDRHMGWDDADMDGNFSFNFQFTSDVPANQISSAIRLYVRNGNDFVTTYSGSLLNTNVSFSIAQATTTVNAAAQIINVDMDRGFAIRFLTRARQCVATRMGMSDIPRVGYNVIGGAPTAWYSTTSEMITFRGGTSHNAGIAYHEYGHYVHHQTDEFMPTDGCGGDEGHWFTKETSFACAYTEGWAEFFSAVCLEYWYVEEMPNLMVPTTGTFEPRCNTHNWDVYQFLDYSQQLLCNQDRTKVEGAVATFFYSLYDGYGMRAPNYSGDNDDLSFSGAFIRGTLQAGRVYGYNCNCSYIQGFKNALQDGLSAYQLAEKISSLNALYSTLILAAGRSHSATPTQLQVEGSLTVRTLRWNDNTCPPSLTYNLENGGTSEFPLVQNQEDGFHIYRRQVQNTDWNGTLGDFTLIRSVNSNVIGTSDNEALAPGMYRYVVIAHNNSGLSIPSATAIVTCSTSATPVNEVLSNEIIDIDRSVVASGDITTENIEVNNSIKLELCAGESIVLKPGLTVTGGAQLHAHIDVCIGCSNVTQLINIIGFNSAFNNPERPAKEAHSPLTIQADAPLSVIPTPAGDAVTIVCTIPDGATPHELHILDPLGSRVSVLPLVAGASGTTSIDVSTAHFPAGFYCVVLKTINGLYSAPLLIVR